MRAPVIPAKAGIQSKGRRRFLAAGICSPAAALLAGCDFSFEQGLMNECRAPSKVSPAAAAMIAQAWSGLHAADTWDCHVHLFGNGHSGAGVFLGADMDKPRSIGAKARRVFFMNGGCVSGDEARFDPVMVAAHCASLGTSPDLDANRDESRAPTVANFALFTRLMSERRYEGRLYGDISAVTQANRASMLPAFMARAPGWEGRLLNGSDYPLPGVMPLFSLNRMVSEGLLAESAVPTLRELRHCNPLAFDFVMKRNLALNGKRIPASAFETRPFFDQSSVTRA